MKIPKFLCYRTCDYPETRTIPHIQAENNESPPRFRQENAEKVP